MLVFEMYAHIKTLQVVNCWKLFCLFELVWINIFAGRHLDSVMTAFTIKFITKVKTDNYLLVNNQKTTFLLLFNNGRWAANPGLFLFSKNAILINRIHHNKIGFFLVRLWQTKWKIRRAYLTIKLKFKYINRYILKFF